MNTANWLIRVPATGGPGPVSVNWLVCASLFVMFPLTVML
jgi:hypothetical protein